MALFINQPFTAHSGGVLPFKIDCDTLTDDDLATLASAVAAKFKFSTVIGVPRGGLLFADALLPYCVPGYGLLVVDDVLTTGRSMEEYRQPGAQGVVIFARGVPPEWIAPMFSFWKVE